MADQFPAKSVSITKIFRAHCNVPGCGFNHRNPDPAQRPGEYSTFAEASAERERHLTWHRLDADETANREA